MSGGVSSIGSTHEVKPLTEVWEGKRTRGLTTFTLKKVVFTIIGLANLAALGYGVYSLCMCFSTPYQVRIMTPFIVGILLAMTQLKVPTMGVTNRNLTQFLTPAIIAGRLAAYVLFGPLMLISSLCDWTPYHDRLVAKRITADLESQSFAKISERYGTHLKNLCRYGFISEKHLPAVEWLHTKMAPLQAKIQFYTKELGKNSTRVRALEGEVETLETHWVEIGENVKPQLPQITVPDYDFSSPWVKIRLGFRRFFCLNPVE